MNHKKKYHKIAVLSGGLSKERDVSLVSSQKTCNALLEKGYDAYLLDPSGKDWITDLMNDRPDAVLNMLHGRFGEDGTIQGVLELLQIPYTHSGVTASAIAMDKVHTKTILAAHGLNVPQGFTAAPQDIYRIIKDNHNTQTGLQIPVVVKPINEGSSVGVIIAHKIEDLEFNIFPKALQSYDNLMVEEYISGRELTVTVFQGEAFTVTEIVSDEIFYDYKAKYSAGCSRHILPADIPDIYFNQCLKDALSAHELLGCRGITRTDFRYREGDSSGIYLLEINTQPGMTPTSLAPEQAHYVGISYADLVEKIVEDASCNR